MFQVLAAQNPLEPETSTIKIVSNTAKITVAFNFFYYLNMPYSLQWVWDM